MAVLNEITATEASSLMARGEVSAEELTRACLDRIQAREPVVQAWEYLDPEDALEQARRADKRRRDGESEGPLDGIPVGIKDVIDTADMPTEHGSPLFAGRRPDRDALCVRALREAGAVILGKTVTTELANLHPNRTQNPHDPAHTPGGSSSGSAAGVADMHMPLALGTQTGGSVIRPASFNGIHGLKPTLGLIPRHGVLLQSHTLDTVGVFGRSIEDLALITDTLSLHDSDDPQSYTGQRQNLMETLNRQSPRPHRLAFLRTPAWDVAEAAAREAIEGVAASLGDLCEERDLPSPWDRVTDLHACVMAAEGYFHYGEHLRNRPELISEVLKAHLERGRAIPANDYIEALRAREQINRELEELLSGFDAVICLSAPGPAPRGLETTGNPIFNGLWTYLGVPCVSLPRMTLDGLPIGIQLIGRRGGESELLQTAAWLDQLLQEAD